jgi:hypothetical protein
VWCHLDGAFGSGMGTCVVGPTKKNGVRTHESE